MEEYEYMSPLDKLLVALKEHEWECISDDASDSLIVIDTNGDPHECWDCGSPDRVNVVVAMTIDDALTFFSNPLQIADAERMFKANVDKNNDIADLLSENAKLRELVRNLWSDACEFDGFWDYVHDDGEIYNEDELPHYQECMRELRIEVE